MNDFTLSYIDIGIMIAYVVIIIIYGLSKAKRNSSEEYFLAGRNMIWPIVGISLFAANISSTTLIGLASDGYQSGIGVYNYEWMAAVVLVFFAIFFMPFYLRSRVYTMPEFLERRYDERSRYYFSFMTIVGNVIIDTAAGLYAGNLILKIIFPEVDSAILIIILALSSSSLYYSGRTFISSSYRSNSSDSINSGIDYSYLLLLCRSRRMGRYDSRIKSNACRRNL